MYSQLIIRAFFINIILLLPLATDVEAWTFEGKMCFIDLPAGWDVNYNAKRNMHELFLPDTIYPIGLFEEISHGGEVITGREWWEGVKHTLTVKYGKNIAFYREMGLKTTTLTKANATDGFMADFMVYEPRVNSYTSYYSWCFIRNRNYVIGSFSAPTSLYPVYEVGFETVCRGFRFKSQAEIDLSQRLESEQKERAEIAAKEKARAEIERIRKDHDTKLEKRPKIYEEALAHYEAGYYELALIKLDGIKDTLDFRADDKKPNDADIWLLYAKIYEVTNKNNEGLKAAEKAKEMGVPEAITISERITKKIKGKEAAEAREKAKIERRRKIFGGRFRGVKNVALFYSVCVPSSIIREDSGLSFSGGGIETHWGFPYSYITLDADIFFSAFPSSEIEGEKVSAGGITFGLGGNLKLYYIYPYISAGGFWGAAPLQEEASGAWGYYSRLGFLIGGQAGTGAVFLDVNAKLTKSNYYTLYLSIGPVFVWSGGIK